MSLIECYFGDGKSSLEMFATVERRIKQKEEALADIENELNLLKQQGFRTYRDEVRYYRIGSSNMWSAAQKWLSMLKRSEDSEGRKLDKRRKYSEKCAFEHMQDLLRTMLCADDLSITNILEYNFGEGWDVYFSYADHEWVLFIPVVENVKMRSYESYGMCCFQLRLSFCKSSCVSTNIGTTFEEDELKGIMRSGVEKYCLNCKQ